jgi:hypothetical protein
MPAARHTSVPIDANGFEFGQFARQEGNSEKEDPNLAGRRPRFSERELQSNSLSTLAAVIAKLPLQQRRVAEILRDNSDAKVGTKEVIELYRNAHGATLTPAAAKSSMAVVRTKLRAALKQASAD